VKRILISLCIVFIMIFNGPTASFANVGTLVDCDKSPAFTKRLNASVKKLEGRLAKYEAGTPPALALQQQIEQTKTRFTRYSESGLLCGADGLPHLVADGDWAHAPEFMIPGVMFLYTTGWIGWSGRKYIQTVATSKNPTEKEIIIDVPLALNIMFSGYLWPVSAWGEFVSGDFVAEPDDITISPR
jgi:photosystem I subunit III